jgi:hypothetical protein
MDNTPLFNITNLFLIIFIISFSIYILIQLAKIAIYILCILKKDEPQENIRRILNDDRIEIII